VDKDLLTLAVPMKKFAKMVDNMEDSFPDHRFLAKNPTADSVNLLNTKLCI